ncbi:MULTISPECIES: dienelactone hydrolase family protein [Janibacter]|uniref:dienelactone hydrolase family protein n=1 Tax=Janibacter TaxID=53457 RepID=UPI00083857AB|nr:dienelactone hydrolase family protein [Janibacter terrae]MBA4085438.1 dienelactone hydrolase family protein [Kytococcus sp.]HBO54106.1 dienelactone hydrolase family protein [Janibacter terrae]HCE59888.1 dienelactone hydrolase family protein [Janibacter terrae]
MAMRPLVEIPAADGTAEAVVARPDADGTYPGVLLWMDAIGLRPRIEEMADRIASWGYIVLAPNTFYRLGSAAEMSPPAGTDLTDPEQRATYGQLSLPRVAELTKERTEADVAPFVAALRALPGVAEGPIGTTGYCMGAKHATRAACVDPSIAACGGFHGAHVASDGPDSPHLSLGSARAAFVYGHADRDGTMPPEMVERLDAALAEHGLQAQTAIYPDAPHGFTMSDTSSYQEAGAERHFAELEELFARTLQAGGEHA